MFYFYLKSEYILSYNEIEIIEGGKMEYIIIGLLVLILIVSVISLTKNVNESNITERLGKLETEMIRELGTFKSDLSKSLNDDFERLNNKIDERLNLINDKVNERLDQNFEKTNKTFI